MKLLTAERMAVARGAAHGVVGRLTDPGNSKNARCGRGAEASLQAPHQNRAVGCEAHADLSQGLRWSDKSIHLNGAVYHDQAAQWSASSWESFVCMGDIDCGICGALRVTVCRHLDNTFPRSLHPTLTNDACVRNVKFIDARKAWQKVCSDTSHIVWKPTSFVQLQLGPRRRKSKSLLLGTFRNPVAALAAAELHQGSVKLGLEASVTLRDFVSNRQVKYHGHVTCARSLERFVQSPPLPQGELLGTEDCSAYSGSSGDTVWQAPPISPTTAPAARGGGGIPCQRAMPCMAIELELCAGAVENGDW